MPGWAEQLTIAEAIVTGSLIIGFAAGLWGAIKKVHPVMRRLMDFLDDWGGEPDRPGVPGRAGVLERLEIVERLADETNANTKPNHGGSSHDQLMQKLNCLDTKLGALGERMDESEEDRRKIHAVIDVACPACIEMRDNGHDTTQEG